MFLSFTYIKITSKDEAKIEQINEGNVWENK